MDGFIRSVKNKPRSVYIGTALYLIGTAFVKWGVFPPLPSILYIAGGVIGMFLLEAAETFFRLYPSPFRSVVFMGGFVIVSLFVLTSSSNYMAIGLVLSLYITLIFLQLADLRKEKRLDTWYRLVSTVPDQRTQGGILVLFIAVFAVLTIMFSFIV